MADNIRLGAEIFIDYDSGEISGAITDIDRFGQAAEQAGEQAEEFTEKAKPDTSLSGSWTELKSQLDTIGLAFEKAQQAAQQAYEFISSGADLNRAEQQFESLSRSIGTTSDVLLYRMQEATAGMVSNADLMASANDIINLGMGSTADEVTRLSSLVGQLGWDMETLTLTLANQSTARLDSLGLSITDVKGRMADLEQQGYSTDEAFKFAVIEAGEEKLLSLGSAADTTAGDLARLESAWANATDQIAQDTARILADPISMFADFISESGKAEMAVRSGIVTQEEFNAAFARGGEWQREINDLYDARITKMSELQAGEQQIENAYATTAESLDEVVEAHERATIGQRATARAAYDYVSGLIAAGEAQDEAAAKQQALTDAVNDANAAWVAYKTELEQFGGQAFVQIAAMEQPMFDVANAMYEYAAGAGAGADELGRLGVQLGRFDQETADIATAGAQAETVIRSLSEAAADGIITWEQYPGAVAAAIRQVEVGPVQPVDEFDASAFFESGGDNFKKGITDPLVGAVETAVNESRGIVEEFSEEEYTVNVELEGIEASTDEAKTYIENTLPDEIRIPVFLDVQNADEIEDYINE